MGVLFSGRLFKVSKYPNGGCGGYRETLDNHDSLLSEAAKHDRMMYSLLFTWIGNSLLLERISRFR